MAVTICHNEDRKWNHAAPNGCPDWNGNVGGYFCPLVPNVPVRAAVGGSVIGTPVLHFLIT